MASDVREARRYEVYGIVQGVGFRHFVRTAARDLELDGWARNRRDGSVEVVVAGPPVTLETFGRQLRFGPPAARVERVDEVRAELPPRGFTVRFD